MADFLRISGLPIDVQDGLQASTDHVVGEHFRTETGALRSTVQRHLRAWTFRTVPLTEEQADFLRSWAPHGQEQVCSGAFLGGDGSRAVVCQVLYSSDAYTPDNTGYERELTITLKQKWRVGVLAPDGSVEYPPEAGSGVSDPAVQAGSESQVLEDLLDDHDQAPVARNPLPRFLIDPPIGHRETLFTLDGTNTIAGEGAEWFWDLGDGTRAEGAIVTHRFWRDGTFQITLRVVDEYGEAVVYGFITVTSTLAPTPGLTMDPGGRNRKGTNINFKSTATGLGPLFVEWFFGDGVEAVGDEVSHEYSANGSFPLRQRITDAYGADAEMTMKVEVGEEPGVLSAAFDVNPQTGPTGTVFSVDASEALGDIDSYAWAFGDGSSAQGMTASHAYAEEGVHTITLVVTTPDGASAQASRTVTVAPAAAPAAPFISAEAVEQTRVQLVGSAFEDANPESTHAASQWQVSATNDFSGVLIHDSGEDSPDLVRHEVPGLTAATAYHARARYRDDSGQWSLWSEVLQLATTSGEELPAEPDEPGIPGDETSGGEPGSGGEDSELPPEDEEEAEEGAPGRPVLSIGNKGEDDIITDKFVQMALSSFQSGGAEGESHLASRWQLALDDAFENVSYDSGWDINYKEARTVQHLAGETTYYARGAHKASTGKLSEWSAGVSFKTSKTPAADATEIWRIIDAETPGECVAHYDMRFRSRMGADEEIIIVEDPRRERKEIPPLRSIMPGQGPKLKLDFPENYEIMPWAEPYRTANFAVDKILTTGPSKYLKEQLGGECALVVIARCKGGGSAAVLAQLLQGDPAGNKNQLLLTYDFGEDGITARTPSQEGAEATVTQENARLKTAKRRLVHAFRSEHNVGVFVATTSTTTYELAAEESTTTTTNPDGTSTTTTTTGLDLGTGADVTRLTVGPITTGGGADFEFSSITVLKHRPSAALLEKIKVWAVAKHDVDLTVSEAPDIPELELVDATHESLTVKIVEFVDANGDSHKQTEWQLSETENFDVLVAGGWYPYIDPNEEDPVEGPPPEIPPEEDAKKVQILMPDLDPVTTYYVRARVKDSGNNISGWSEPLEVATEQAPWMPTAVITLSPQPWYTDAEITYSGTSSTGTSALTYAWDVDNNGTWDNSGDSVVIARPQPGTYTVRLRVTDADGNTHIADSMITITAAPSGLQLISDSRVACEDFADAGAASRFTKVAGNGSPSVVNGRLRFVGPESDGVVRYATPVPADIYVQFLMSRPAITARLGLMFRMNANGSERFLLYALDYQGGGNSEIALNRIAGGVWTMLNYGNLGFMPGSGDYRYLFKIQNNVFSSTHGSYTTPIALAHTGIGLYAGGLAGPSNWADFDDIYITKARSLQVVNLPAGYYANYDEMGPQGEAGGYVQADANGVATLTLYSHLKLRATKLTVRNAAHQVVFSVTPPEGIWEGQIWKYNP